MGNLSLPRPPSLERICKGLATLDAIISEEWESRYYSFDSAWDKKAKQRMASMRNGQGDEWFIVFDGACAFLKAFWHEFPHQNTANIYAGIPGTLTKQTAEPAFSMEYVTCGGWYDGAEWTIRGNAAPMEQELEMLRGVPEHYREYAGSYFEVDIAVDDITHVLSGKKLTTEIVERIGPGRTLASLKKDLAQIDY